VFESLQESAFVSTKLRQKENDMKCKVILFAVLLFTSLLALASPPAKTHSPDAVAAGFVQAWNSHDKNEFTRLFIENAYWVPAVDVRLDGREKIVADLGKAHQTWAKETTMGASDMVVRPLRPDVAVVLFHAGFLDKDGKLMAPGNALLLVVVKQAEGWRIAAGQLTKPGSTNMPRP
jgi:uncharacterized protein (TIGR02246 family)